MIEVVHALDYYGDAGAQELSHAFKRGSVVAIKEIALVNYCLVPSHWRAL